MPRSSSGALRRESRTRLGRAPELRKMLDQNKELKAALDKKSEVREILELGKKSTQPFVVGYQRRCDRNYRALKQQVGTLGDLDSEYFVPLLLIKEQLLGGDCWYHGLQGGQISKSKMNGRTPPPLHLDLDLPSRPFTSVPSYI